MATISGVAKHVYNEQFPNIKSKASSLLANPGRLVTPALMVAPDMAFTVISDGFTLKSVAKGLASGFAWYRYPGVMWGYFIGSTMIDVAKTGYKLYQGMKNDYINMYQHFGTGYVDTEHKATMRQRGLAAAQYARSRVSNILGMEARELRRQHKVW